MIKNIVFDGDVQKLREHLQEMQTLNYYDAKAQAYAGNTVNADMQNAADRFLSCIPSGGSVLDFGCGSGRDAKYFLEQGFCVTAADGSKKMCEIAKENTGIEVQCMSFEDLCEKDKYDGIWACASILHLPKDRLYPVFEKMRDALKEGGHLYVSFKYGEFEGMRDGRYFTDFTVGTFSAFLGDMSELKVMRQWISMDVRPDRSEEEWLNVILQKVPKDNRSSLSCS